MALARSAGAVKTLVMFDMATGLSIDPPTAWTILVTMSNSRFGARLHSREPTVNEASPSWNVRRRPIRSAVEPEAINSAANVSV